MYISTHLETELTRHWLVIVWIVWGRFVVEEMVGAQRRIDGMKHQRSLVEVEAVRKIVAMSVSVP